VALQGPKPEAEAGKAAIVVVLNGLNLNAEYLGPLAITLAWFKSGEDDINGVNMSKMTSMRRRHQWRKYVKDDINDRF